MGGSVASWWPCDFDLEFESEQQLIDNVWG